MHQIVKRKRKGLRPLSQSGLRRIAQNANQRPIGEGGVVEKRHVLDAFNDTQADRYLHPTKGWRRLSAKRSVAAMITAEMRKGVHHSLRSVRDMLRGIPA